MKKLLLGVMLGFVTVIGGCGIVLAGCVANMTVTENPKKLVDGKVVDNDKKRKFKINDTVRIANIDYTVRDVTVSKGVEEGVYDKTKPKDTYVIVDIEIKNSDRESYTILEEDIQLSLGSKIYTADGSRLDNDELGDSFSHETINPDSKVTGKFFFDVTEKTANEKDLQVKISSGKEINNFGYVQVNSKK